MQIADWLEKLGMSEYVQRFAENGINVAALPHLTDRDLKDIGVLLGHRRVMLAAISKLAGTAPALYSIFPNGGDHHIRLIRAAACAVAKPIPELPPSTTMRFPPRIMAHSLLLSC